MSETVHYKGKLYKVDKLENETVEYQCKRLLDNQELDEFYDSYKEMLLEDCYDRYIECDGVLYEFSKENIDPDAGIFRIIKNDDQTIDYEVRYYNGGCCFSEAIERAFKRSVDR